MLFVDSLANAKFFVFVDEVGRKIWFYVTAMYFMICCAVLGRNSFGIFAQLAPAQCFYVLNFESWNHPHLTYLLYI